MGTQHDTTQYDENTSLELDNKIKALEREQLKPLNEYLTKLKNLPISEALESVKSANQKIQDSEIIKYPEIKNEAKATLQEIQTLYDALRIADAMISTAQDSVPSALKFIKQGINLTVERHNATDGKPKSVRDRMNKFYDKITEIENNFREKNQELKIGINIIEEATSKDIVRKLLLQVEPGDIIIINNEEEYKITDNPNTLENDLFQIIQAQKVNTDGVTTINKDFIQFITIIIHNSSKSKYGTAQI